MARIQPRYTSKCILKELEQSRNLEMKEVSNQLIRVQKNKDSDGTYVLQMSVTKKSEGRRVLL